MKKTAIIIAALVLGSLMAPVAQAVPPGPRWEGGEECRNLYLAGYTQAQVRVCVLINTNEQGLFGDVEGMVRARRLTGKALDWEVDYVHLYRGGVLREQSGPWEWTRIIADEPGEWERRSTSFIGCNGDVAYFRAVARFRIRELYHDTGSWQKWDSQTLLIDC